jgi:hypothetical protein
MYTDQVFIILGKLGGFVDVCNTEECASKKVKELETNNKYEDSFEIVSYHVNSSTEEISKQNIVYIMLTVNTDLPLLVTKDKKEFIAKHDKFLKLFLTYPEPSEFWEYNIKSI